MILAAGLGTRLRPLTDDRPKALVELSGTTLLQITLQRFKEFGITEAVINIHAFADSIVAYLAAHQNFGMTIHLSREKALLDTGGGLRRAAPMLADSDPFLLHNVDVISDFDLHAMLAAHQSSGALATLAVQQRPTSRALLFDPAGQLCGHHTGAALERVDGSGAPLTALAFAGIHFVSPRIFSLLPQQEVFSIISAYLAIARDGGKVCAFRQDDARWRDLGTPHSLQQAAQDAELQARR